MGFSHDVLTTALQKLMPGYSETFTKWHPAFDMIVKGGRRQRVEAPWVEFVIVPDGPGTLNARPTGQELVTAGRNENGVRGNVFVGTSIYAYAVPGQDLREAGGKADIAKIIQSYPDRALAHFHEIVAKQLVAGNVSNASNLPTWNGDATYNPKNLGARGGHFSFAPRDTQTGAVFGITRNSVAGWHNQQREVTSFKSDGREKMRDLKWDIQQEVSGEAFDADLIFCDRGTYRNYVKDLDQQVQIVETSFTRDGDRAKGKFRKGIHFDGAEMYQDTYITADAFTTAAAQEGVAYFIHSPAWHMIYQGGEGQTTPGNFSMDPNSPRIPSDRDEFIYWLILSMGLYCDAMRTQGVLVGGARE